MKIQEIIDKNLLSKKMEKLYKKNKKIKKIMPFLRATIYIIPAILFITLIDNILLCFSLPTNAIDMLSMYFKRLEIVVFVLLGLQIMSGTILLIFGKKSIIYDNKFQEFIISHNKEIDNETKKH